MPTSRSSSDSVTFHRKRKTSNGLKVDEDEALILTPMDPEVIRELFDEFGKKVDKYKKKEATKKNQPQTRKRKKKKSK